MTVAVQPAPIQADWIRSGTPDASNVIVARSSDRSAYTMVWECTAGAFEWTYDCDETVYILEGSILLSDAGNPQRRLSAGDAVFFPKGAKVSWQVEGFVRKLAFMHDMPPAPVTAGLKAYRRLLLLKNAFLARLARSPAAPVATEPLSA
jgi:uncharacterized cupin superfamily protein